MGSGRIYDRYELRGSRYTPEELECLRSGDIRRAFEGCRDRHSYAGIYSAFSRISAADGSVRGVPKVLYRLCIRLGLLNVGSRPAELWHRRIGRVQKEIIAYLSALPNASLYREENWLDTPELWAVADPEQIVDNRGDSVGDLRSELLRRMESWCDSWIPFSSVSNSDIRKRLRDIYLFPYRDGVVGGVSRSGRKKGTCEKRSWLPLSQSYLGEVKREISPFESSRVLALYGRVSIGCISFKCRIPVARVLRILEENGICWQNSA